MTTTASAIRASIASRIAALVPTTHAGDRFRQHRYGEDLAEWAVANPSGAFRRFSVREAANIEPAQVSDALVEGVWQAFTVQVAYPKSWRAGAEQLVDLDTIINADRVQIHRTVGTPSQTNPVTIITDGEDREDLEAVVLGVVRLRAYYYRSVS